MTTKTRRSDNDTGRLLRAELDRVASRLRAEGELPEAALVGSDFLDVAQDVERQELAFLTASRLSERARRLQSALARLRAGEYGVCSSCGAPIPPKRLLAVPDTTTCVACQERLERVGDGSEAS
jgi:phage/conjugal plasmid C-4 type zinc finger TraR family protein